MGLAEPRIGSAEPLMGSVEPGMGNSIRRKCTPRHVCILLSVVHGSRVTKVACMRVTLAYALILLSVVRDGRAVPARSYRRKRNSLDSNTDVVEEALGRSLASLCHPNRRSAVGHRRLEQLALERYATATISQTGTLRLQGLQLSMRDGWRLLFLVSRFTSCRLRSSCAFDMPNTTLRSAMMLAMCTCQYLPHVMISEVVEGDASQRAPGAEVWSNACSGLEREKETP